MTPRPFTLWLVALMVALPLLGLSGLDAARAAGTLRDARSRRDRVAALASDLDRVRTELPDWSRRAQASQGLSTRVSGTLPAAGLAPSTVVSLSADGQTVIGGTPELRLIQRHAVLVLSGPTLPQTGAFLNAWRTREPDWAIVSLELAPTENPGQRSPVFSTGGDLPLRVVLRFETLTLQEGEHAR